MHWLSRRHPAHIRSTVYMLQASEYSIRDFLRWYGRVKDFRHVEKRKRLDLTLKAILLLAAGWLSVLFTVLLAYYALNTFENPWNYIIAAIVAIEVPMFTVVGTLAVLILLRIIQKPIEWFLVWRASSALARHKGIKIAIAGSFGKTSMREVLKTVLSENRKVAAPKDSRNTPLGIAKFVHELDGDEHILIFEFGEYYPGDIRLLGSMVRPEWGIITGVNEAHLEKFGTVEEAAETIFELAEFVEPSKLYVNGDSALARAQMKTGNKFFTQNGTERLKVENAQTSLQGTSFTLKGDDVLFKAHSKLCGLHILGTLAVAADIASRLGIAKEDIERGLSKTEPFAHRLQPKEWADGVTFIDDSYNGNPDGARAAIQFLASLKGRRFYVTPGLVEGGARHRIIHEDIGRELAKTGIEKVALIKTSATPHIELALKTMSFKGEILHFDDMLSCLKALQALAVPGDIILIQNDWPDQYT